MRGLFPKIILLDGSAFAITVVSMFIVGTLTGQPVDRLIVVALGGGLLVLGPLTYYSLQRRVLEPLQEIQHGALAVAQGDFDYRLNVQTGDEMEALAREFNQMALYLKQFYDQRAEERGKVMAALEASRDAIWVSDSNRQIMMVNSALENLTGRSRGDLLGQTCRNLFGVRTLSGHSICEATCPFLEPDKESGGVEGCIPTASGNEAWVEISYGRVKGPGDRLAGVVHIVHDLTERKEIERLKDDFISMVSHELRSPLHHIKGFATTLLQTDVEWDKATQQDFLASINREADRLSNLVEKILHISRLEADGLPLEREWYQPADLIDMALQRRRGLVDGRGFSIHMAEDLPALFVDGRDIEIVLINLIENAVKYSEANTPVDLSVFCDREEVVFCVEDSGVGIPEKELSRIFERFYRVNEGNGGVGGTGLGLPICRRIVESHGGKIWVDSEENLGSQFYFSVPFESVPILRD